MPIAALHEARPLAVPCAVSASPPLSLRDTCVMQGRPCWERLWPWQQELASCAQATNIVVVQMVHADFLVKIVSVDQDGEHIAAIRPKSLLNIVRVRI